MIGNLEPQKRVDAPDRVCVPGGDPDARSAPGIFQLVLDRIAEFLHCFPSGRILRVDEHGRGKIARGEHLDDVREVRANFILGGDVLRGVRLHFDGATIGIQAKVVRGFVMWKTHNVIAPLDNTLVMRVLRRGFVLGRCGFVRRESAKYTECQDGYCKRRVHSEDSILLKRSRVWTCQPAEGCEECGGQKDTHRREDSSRREEGPRLFWLEGCTPPPPMFFVRADSK